MAVRGSVGVTVLFLATVLAGCLEGEGPAVDLGHEHDHEAMDLDWVVAGTRCLEGGFVAAYNTAGKYFVEPWERADIRQEIGNPRLSALVLPLTGPATGHWHQGIRCDEVTHNGTVLRNFQFGYVSGAVKPPPFDPGGAQFHQLLAGFGFVDSEPRSDLRAKTTAEITQTLESRIAWSGPAGGPAYVDAVYDDKEKGTYLSHGAVRKYRDVSERTIRFWWVVPANGSRAQHDHHFEAEGVASEAKKGFHPVYWDLKTAGGAQYTTPDSLNVACHMGTDDHGPQGGACQPTLTNVYEHKSLELRYGGILTDVLLQHEWLH